VGKSIDECGLHQPFAHATPLEDLGRNLPGFAERSTGSHRKMTAVSLEGERQPRERRLQRNLMLAERHLVRAERLLRHGGEIISSVIAISAW
jgi:hypothetical protein